MLLLLMGKQWELNFTGFSCSFIHRSAFMQQLEARASVENASEIPYVRKQFSLPFTTED